MELLDQYLKSVKPYLPRAQKNDILKELAENILSQMEDQAAQLGRPLNQAEQETLLQQYGQPMVVAGRYQQDGGRLVFGRQLIGPELFSKYVAVLCLNLAITVAIFVGYAIAAGRLFSVPQFLFPASVQFGCVTLVFILVDRWERRSHHWNAVPPHERPIPRWQSVSGIAGWSIFTLWLLAVPLFPRLLFGTAAGHLTLAEGWPMFYVPILLLLLAGLAQRFVNLVHPDWTWLLPATRLAVNGLGFAVLFFFRNSHLVAVADPTYHLAHYERLAEIFNAAILRGLLGYLLINAIIHACICASYSRRRMSERAPSRSAA
ncbi:MAG: hypothetical protein LAQ69_02720 [Acidobacteriia bacterium]|nr:hypothetical protein [Terriglobia bacterium]